MKPNNTKYDKLGNEKVYAKNDTSYSSFWLYNKDKDILSEHFKDTIVLKDKNIFSEFNPTIAKNIISFWSEPNNIILDPFAGRSRGFISGIMNRQYIGFEIVNSTYNYLLNKNSFDNVSFINDDCLNLPDYNIPEVDMIFTCPPYWDIERYESCDGQLSDIGDYKEFIYQLKLRFKQSLNYLKKDGYMCLVVGDFRKNGKYYTFHKDILEMFEEDEEVKLHDIIIVQNIPFHTAAFYFGNNKKFKKTSKVHEYIIVFKKTS